MKSGARAQSSIVITASPDVLYDMVADVTNMGRWSAECRGCEWIDGATGPAVGARFKGSNRRGAARWSTTPRVVAADRGQEFSFVTGHRGQDMTAWTYEFVPQDGATLVSESFEMLRDMPWYFRVADRVLMGVSDRHADLTANLDDTLAKLKVAAEDRAPTDSAHDEPPTGHPPRAAEGERDRCPSG
jgi:hypothetical protein